MTPLTIPMTIQSTDTTVDVTVEDNSQEISYDLDHVTTPVQIDFTADAETLAAGSDVSVTYSQKHFHFAIPQGLQGEQGPQGETGATGSPGRDGIDGKDGKDGKDGQPGRDGITPDMSAYRTAAAQDLIDATIPTKTSQLTNDAGYITGMTILSYGHSTWEDFLAAYTANKVVYCRASSGNNPGSGSQTRLAFMAYVSSADPASITSVEFQYYRSVNAHSASQQGDQVYVYKLDKTAGWTVTVRENYTKIVAGTKMSSSYNSGTLTLNFNGTIPSTAGDVGAIAAPASPTSGDFLVYDGSAWVAQSLSTWQGGNY